MTTNQYLYNCHEIISIAPDIAKITLIPENAPLHYEAGQYIQVALPDEILLPLSIANIPNPSGTLEFHLRHNQTHPFAEQFLNLLAQNKNVLLSGPFGSSTLEQATDYKNLLFLAGGTGFAPIKALLEHALTQQRFQTIMLFWGICRPFDAYEENLLIKWAQLYPHFHYTLVLSEPEEYLSWEGAKGFVHEYCLDQCQDLKDYCVFMSGPFPMIKSAQALFKNRRHLHCKLVSDLIDNR